MHREKPDSGKSPGAFGAGLGLGLLSAVSNILLFAGPLFMLQIYDRVLSSKSVPTLAALTGLIVVLYGFYSLVEIVRARMATRYCMLASSRMTRPVFSRLLVSHARPNQQTGTDPVNDVDIVRQFLGSAAPLALLDLPWVPVFLFVVFAFHPYLGWLAIAGAGVVAVLMVLNEWLAHGPSRQTNDAAMGRRAQQIDVTINAESVLAMGMGRAMSDRWEEASNTLMTSQIRAADRATVFSALTKSSRLLLQSAVLAMGAFLAIGGDISPGLMIAASIMTARALSPIEQVVTNWRSFVQARQARKRLKVLLAGVQAVPEGMRHARSLLAPLLTGRPQRDRRLLSTLRAVLDHPGLSEAAAALGIHRNTLAYRLARIEQLAGWQLSDKGVRFGLALAVRLVQNEQERDAERPMQERPARVDTA
jgi:ATP-binding cassette, subfamily C, bacterial PrsD